MGVFKDMDLQIVQLPETVGVALLVLADKFGTGEERKKALKEAGYDAHKVQLCVNDLVEIIERYK